MVNWHTLWDSLSSTLWYGYQVCQWHDIYSSGIHDWLILALRIIILLWIQYNSVFKTFFFSKVELALTSDGRTIVCYHPSVDIPYEHTKVCMRKFLIIFNLLLEIFTLLYSNQREGFPFIWFLKFGLDFLLTFTVLIFLLFLFHRSLKAVFSTQGEPFKHNYGISFLV